MHENRLYKVLVTLRFLLIFTYGYIHPDEFFQSPSVTSSLLFPHHHNNNNKTNIIPWEFQQGQRSLLPIFINSGVPLLLIKWISFVEMSVNVLLFTPRVYLFVWSLLMDRLIEKLTSKRGKVVYCALWPVLLFHTRTFSNTTEAFSLVMLMYIVFHVIRYQSLLVGAMSAFGFFTRFTFPMFAWSFVIYHVFVQSKGKNSLLVNLKVIIARIRDCIIGFLTITTICVFIDSNYYQTYTITPLNNLIYNTKTENLALHTLHPRYLHLLVNLPMLYGPLVLIILIKMIQKRSELRTYSHLFWTSLFSIVSGIGLLSLAPHQEPRFLLPLTAPLVVLYHQLVKDRKIKWLLSYALVLCLFYGYFHQAGVIRSMSQLEKVNINSDSTVVFEGTYMPPMYLMLMKRQIGNLTLVDLAGSVDDSLSCAEFIGKVCSPNTYVVTSRIDCFKQSVFCIFPHVSTEDMNRSLAANLNICAFNCSTIIGG